MGANEFLWLALLFGSFAGIVLAYRLFGKTGLYVWTALAVVVANVQVLKLVSLFGLTTALGNVVYGTTFLVTDILAEKYGERDARRAVFLGFFCLIGLTLLMQLCLAFRPHPEDTLSGPLQQVFGFLPRVTVASLSAYLLSQTFDVWFFGRLRRATKGRWLWLRNNVSTMVSQLIDNVVFTWIFWVGPFGLFGWDRQLPWGTILSIFGTSYVLKWIVAACDTPFVYLAKRIEPAGGA